jgi:GTP-binding protein
MKPKLALVGRPNVGKSALFNCLCKRRIAIVDEAEGITRDRLYADGDFFGHAFEVIDTGGIDPRSSSPFNDQVKLQAEIAIEEADALAMVVDSQVGATELDVEVARILQRTDKPLILIVNKIDHREQLERLHDFHILGIEKMVPVSATHRFHIAEILEAAFEGREWGEEEDTLHQPKVAIVGRPNVGKSTLVNRLLTEERCIVSPIAGTTRDSIDIGFVHDGKEYTLIDTAGIRRKRGEHEVVDKFAAMRTKKTVERADVCVLLLDATRGMTTQDMKIARQIEDAGNGCILLFNKWDLVKGFRMEHCLKEVRDQVPFLRHCPAIFMSALTGRNVDQVLKLVVDVYEQLHARVTTGQLNRCIAQAMQRNHPPMIGGKRLRVYYLTQVGVAPPTFVLFVNHPDRMADSYKKYLYNQMRIRFPFSGVPIVLRMKGKERQEKGAHPKPSLEDGYLDPSLDDGEATADREGLLTHT